VTWWPFASLRELLDFLLLLATALLGFAGAPRWCIIGTTIGLYSFRWEDWHALGERARKTGSGGTFLLVMFGRLVFIFVVSAAAFGFGRVLRGVADL
jgi:hypothetical protein